MIACATLMSTCPSAVVSRCITPVPWSVASTPTAALLPAVAAPAEMPTSEARRRGLVLPAPLAELARPKVRHLASVIALPTPAHGHVARVR
jgi:hypothetical protein